jgi:hypothetical protein
MQYQNLKTAVDFGNLSLKKKRENLKIINSGRSEKRERERNRK